MRSRSREITLSDGTSIETPLLVPSISSKGFGLIDAGEGEVPAPAAILQLFGGDSFYEALLVSAYDIAFEQVLDPGAFSKGFRRSPYSIPQFLIIDSGWYEAIPGLDEADPQRDGERPRAWTLDRYQELIKSFDGELRAALVSFDTHAPYGEQIDEAQRFFAEFERFSSIVMLKPPGEGSYHQNQIKHLVPVADRLKAFDIVGVTEKELGNTILNRLKTLVALSEALEDAGVEAPIHVFGGLDPLYTPLYFAAGAEIFDGLSWQRYGYHEGLAVYRTALPLIKRQFDKRLPFTLLDAQADNLDALRELSRELKVFHDQDEDWNVLRTGELLKPAHDALLSAVRRQSGR